MAHLPVESPQEKHNYNLKIQSLVIELSSLLMDIDSKNADAIINEVLDKVGEFVDVDRSYIFTFSSDGKTMSNTHEWCADCMHPQIQVLQNIPVEANSWWMKRLTKIKEICVPRVVSLPKVAEKFRDKLMEQTIKALIILPITKDEQLIGFIGFDSTRRERNWKIREIALLRMLGDLVAHALYIK
ncbi:MAG: GAF domain-containing protein [Chloroflexi bacterium]|nr:GAF domain-containing protein [Chloroflexota bacterium]MBT7079977.1 GAF domain-containing protein [Chloroflexota bacterium]MBT7289493.1 GAF domain-containing protein [Chloroflexota bacterium]